MTGILTSAEHATRPVRSTRPMTVVQKEVVREVADPLPGSEDWWSDWITQWGPRLMLYARQFTNNDSAAEEVVQQAVIRFWRSGRFMQEDPRGYLFTCVRSSAIDVYRGDSRRKKRELVVGEQKPQIAWFEDRIAGDERRERIEHAMKGLNPEQREVLVMKIWGELTFVQIAEVMKISPNTAASRYRYALKGLQSELTREEME